MLNNVLNNFCCLFLNLMCIALNLGSHSKYINHTRMWCLYKLQQQINAMKVKLNISLPEKKTGGEEKGGNLRKVSVFYLYHKIKYNKVLVFRCFQVSIYWRINLELNDKDNTRRHRQLRTRRALLQIKDVPLRTRRALLQSTLHSYSTLLVLNGTSLSCNNALLALNWRHAQINFLLLIPLCIVSMVFFMPFQNQTKLSKNEDNTCRWMKAVLKMYEVAHYVSSRTCYMIQKLCLG